LFVFFYTTEVNGEHLCEEQTEIPVSFGSLMSQTSLKLNVVTIF